LYKAKHIHICSGVTLHYIKTDKFKTDKITMLFSAGLDKVYTSYRTLLINVLMTGCRKLPDIKAINDRLYELYGADFASLNTKRGDIQQTGATIKFLNGAFTPDKKSMLAAALETVTDVLFDPLVKDGAFDEKIVGIEKKNLIDSIRADINNKTVYARKKCISLMCENEVYGISSEGEEAVVETIDEKKLYDFYKEFVSKTSLDIYYVGAQSEDEVVNAVRSIFEKIEIAPISCKRYPAVYDVDAVKRVTEEMPVTQGKLSLGFRTGTVRNDKDYAALSIFNVIYGLAPTSKLFTVVREKMSLCYYCRSQLIETKGILLVSSGIECDNKEKAEAGILQQLEEIKNGNVSDDEIVTVKKFYVNMLKSSFDSAGAMVAWTAAESYDGTDREQDDFIRDIMNVTKEDVVRVANKIKLDTVYYLKGNTHTDEV